MEENISTLENGLGSFLFKVTGELHTRRIKTANFK